MLTLSALASSTENETKIHDVKSIKQRRNLQRLHISLKPISRLPSGPILSDSSKKRFSSHGTYFQNFISMPDEKMKSKKRNTSSSVGLWYVAGITTPKDDHSTSRRNPEKMNKQSSRQTRSQSQYIWYLCSPQRNPRAKQTNGWGYEWNAKEILRAEAKNELCSLVDDNQSYQWRMTK